MTYQMALLGERLQGEQLGRTKERETVAIKLIRRGRPLQEIHEDTSLPMQRLDQVANDNYDDKCPKDFEHSLR